ncbi:MAG: prepilin-type N-terminal cleavage/methylation domain-containing protein [Kiritimatiellae bacterium]|nr:prepilin-type N-terminal cleavage/methylation domain-containing protein [Kiritimatiellia bacterium]
MQRNETRSAFTLIEMMCVVAVLAIVALLAAGRGTRIANRARRTAAIADMEAIRAGFMDTGYGLMHDWETLPGFSPATLRIANLLASTNVWGCAPGELLPVRIDGGIVRAGVAQGRFFTEWNEEAQRGWRGGYVNAPKIIPFPACDEAKSFYPALDGLLLPGEWNDPARASAYGFTGEAAIADPWGNPYVLQVPPPQAWTNVATVSATERFKYARIVSAGPDGILSTPCFRPNETNMTETAWNAITRRISRQAGRDGGNVALRGDDLVVFLLRNDIDEGDGR